jgi:hypothetical protein
MVLNLSQNNIDVMQKSFMNSVETINSILSDADMIIQELSKNG